jgi:hypothetical protein
MIGDESNTRLIPGLQEDHRAWPRPTETGRSLWLACHSGNDCLDVADANGIDIRSGLRGGDVMASVLVGAHDVVVERGVVEPIAECPT